jgi:cytochrome c biogenesis protein CcmG, thiol:disulfide interchange protein DsbE
MSSSSTQGLSTRTIVLLLVVVGAVLFGLAFLGGGDEPTESPEVEAAEVSGEPLPQFGGDPASDPAVGMAAPTAVGGSYDGAEVDLTAGSEPTIVLFLAHWCPHCQAEVPEVQAWLEDGGLPEGVTLRAVTTAIEPDQPNYPPDAWLEREGWTVETLVDTDGAVADAYGLSAFPFWTVLDTDGEVLMRFSGRLGSDGLDSLVADLAP